VAPFNPPRTEARVVLVGLAVQAVIRGVLFGLGVATASLEPGPDGLLAYEPLAAVQALGVFAVLAGTAFTGIAWIIWLRTCYANLPALQVLRRYKMWWTVGAWLIPFASLFVPKRITDDALVETRDGRRPGALVTMWWGLFLVDQAASGFIATVDPAGLGLVLALLSMGAVACAAIVVITVTEAQVQRRAELTGEVQPSRTRILGASRRAAIVVMAGITSAATVVALVPLGALAADAEALGDPVGVSQLVAGDCFNLPQAVDFDVVYQVECDAPHNGQSLGYVELGAGSYPGADTIADFTSESCMELYELSTGRPGQFGDPSVTIFYPHMAEWAAGDRRIDCVLFVDTERAWSARLGEPVARTRLRDLQEGRCYAGDLDFVTFREVECHRADFRVDGSRRFSRSATDPFPEGGSIGEAIEETCSQSEWVEAFPPLEETWAYGDRVLLCADYDLPALGGTVF
jgi:hypothetical protein